MMNNDISFEKKQRRVEGIDLLKAIAIVAVVFLHGYFLPTDFVFDATISSLFGYALRIFMVVGVPLFVMINGYLLLSKQKVDLKKHFSKIIKMLILIFVWCVIYQILSNILYGTPFNFKKIIYGCLFAVPEHDGLNNAIGVLWFLRSLVSVYLLFPVLKYVYDNRRLLFFYLFCIVAFFSVGMNLLSLLFMPIGGVIGSDFFSVFQTFVDSFSPFSPSFVTFLMFFMSGGIINIILERVNRSKLYNGARVVLTLSILVSLGYGIIINCLLPGLISLDFLYPSMMMVCGTGALFILLRGFKTKSMFGRFVLTLGQDCFGIYFIHLVFLHIMARLGLYAFLESLPNSIMLWCVTFCVNACILLFSYVVAVVVKRVPCLNWLIRL